MYLPSWLVKGFSCQRLNGGDLPCYTSPYIISIGTHVTHVFHSDDTTYI